MEPWLVSLCLVAQFTEFLYWIGSTRAFPRAAAYAGVSLLLLGLLIAISIKSVPAALTVLLLSTTLRFALGFLDARHTRDAASTRHVDPVSSDNGKQYENALKTIVANSARLSGQPLLDSLVTSLASTLKLKHVFIGELIGPNKDRVQTISYSKDGAMAGSFEYDLADTPCQVTLQNHICRYTDGLQEAFPKDTMLKTLGIQVYIGVRLEDTQGEPLGIVVGLNDQPLNSDELFMSIFSLVASRAGAELEHLRANEALQEAQNFVQRIVDTSPHSVYVFQVAQRHFSFLSPRIWQDLGYSQNDIREHDDLLGVMHPDDLANMPKLLARWEVARDSDVFDSEYRLRHANGTWRNYLLKSTIFRRDNDGRVLETIGVAQDITERRLTEQALVETNERLGMALSAGQLGLWDWYIQTGASLFDEGWSEMLGYRHRELVQTYATWRSLVHPDDLEATEAILMAHVEGKTPFYAANFRMRAKSGEWVWIYDRGKVVEWDDAGAPVRAVGVHVNITEHKRAELALRESERQQASILSSLPGMAYRCQNLPEWPMIYGSEGAFDLTGYTPEELCSGDTPFAKLIHPADQDAIWRAVQQALESKTPYRFGYRIHDKNGEERHVWEQGAGVFDDAGQLLFLEGFISDVTERIRAEDALLRSEQKFRNLFGQAADPMYLHDEKGRFIETNEAACQALGYTSAELMQLTVADVETVINLDEIETLTKRMINQQISAATLLGAHRRKDGSILPVEVRVGLLQGGEHPLFLAIARDITERKRAEEAIRESEERFRGLMEAVPDSILMLDAQCMVQFCNRVHKGYTIDMVIGHSVLDFLGDDESYRMRKALDNAIALGESSELTTKVLDPNGETLWFHNRIVPLHHSSDGTGTCLLVASDITEQRRAAEDLQLSQERFKNAFEHSATGMALVNPKGRFIDANAALCNIVGYTRDELLESDFQSITHPDDLDEDVGLVMKTLRGEQSAFQMEKRYLHKNGSTVWIQLTASLVRDADGAPLHFISQVADITKRREAEMALRASEERLELALQGADLASWDWNLHTSKVAVNDRWFTMLGYEPGEIPTSIESWVSHTHPDDVERVASTFANHIKGLASSYECEYRVRTKQGDYIWILDRARVVERAADGAAVRASGTHLDITIRKQADDERRQLEQQIQHAQKLESLGVRAGGIAHDFNNILVAILGNADLAMSDLSVASNARHCMKEIEVAARRAADLCRQMLAYAGKGRFEIRALNLREVVEEMTNMLEVSISKKVTLKYHYSEHVPTVEADASQLRQIIMNLIINASEAIGDAIGTIAINVGGMTCTNQYLGETYLDGDLSEGVYAYIEVSDSGSGMTEETKARLFEPFFTTKFTGRGLGMSAVLGIVRGHKGAIKVYSELGKGTTFKVLLPAIDKPAETMTQNAQENTTWKGTGTVLLIDDEESVRTIAKRMLERIGFSVLVASDGKEGIEQYTAQHSEIVCVLLDLTMPQMDGEECYRELRAINPNVRVVISSGYNQQEVTQRFIGKGLAGFIQKPYQLAELRSVLHQILE